MSTALLRFVLGVAIVSATLAGCSTKQTATNTPPAINLSSQSVDVPTVQHSPDFATIVTAYRNKNYRGALTRLQALAARTDLSNADRAYLEKQKQICLNALAGKTTDSVVSSPSVSLPVPAQSISNSDCGPRALFYICRETGKPASLAALTRIAHTEPGRGTSMAALVTAANSVGFGAKGVQVDGDALHHVKAPALAWVDGNHYIAVTRIKEESATVYDPNQTNRNGVEAIALDKLLQRSGGVLLLLTPETAIK